MNFLATVIVLLSPSRRFNIPLSPTVLPMLAG